MPTTVERASYLPRALRCFQRQTHSRRELLILDDGPAGLDRLIPADPRIRYVRADRFPNLGAKRNRACELARGDVIAHWDDDDWSHPARLAVQLEHLTGDVTGFRLMVFWDEGRDRAFLYSGAAEREVLGTSLLYRRDWWRANRFPGINVGEDNAFRRHAMRRGRLRVVDGAGLMVATTRRDQGGNPRTIDRLWTPIERKEIPTDYWA